MRAPARQSDSSATPRAIALAAVVLLAATFIAYANSFSVPFIFDDIPTLVENPGLTPLPAAAPSSSAAEVGGLTIAGRPVAAFTFVLNRALGGTEVWSYHLVNILIHASAGLALFGLVRRTLSLPSLRVRYGAEAWALAFAVAALWTLHPLQTESVTYIVQRVESLAGLFFLLTLYAFARGASGPAGAWWRVGSVAACALGMATKETVVAAPLLVLLYDRTFIAGSFRAAWQARRDTYLALAATWLLLAALVLSTEGRGGTAGFGTTISPWIYALTQARALVHYVALSFWPQPLVFDYGIATERSLSAVWPQAGLVLAALGATIWLVIRRPAAGFLAAFFFAVLAPSSSFVPVVTQTMAEHRMYLALAALVAGAVLGVHRLRRITPLAWAGLAAGLLILTALRNRDYRSEISIWADTAEKLPANARAHNNLGHALHRAGRTTEAMPPYERARDLQPNYPEVHYNIGVALAERGDIAAALASYETALRWQPAYPEAHNNLGNALVRAGRVPEALDHFAAALRLKPGFAEAHSNLGNALLQSGRGPEAMASLRRALELKPAYPEANYNLGNALAGAGLMAEALEQYRRALAGKPDYAEACVNAGNASLQLGRVADALAYYEQAVRMNPTLAQAHFNLGSVLLDAERWAEAVPHFEAVLRLDPAATGAHRALGFALASIGRYPEAVDHYERYLRVAPDDAATRAELAAARARMRGVGRGN